MPGSVLIKATLTKSLAEEVVLQDRVLVKTRTVAGRRRDAQTIEVPWSLYTSKVILLQATPPGAKRPPRMASAFLGFHYSGRSNLAEEIGFPEFL